MQDSADHKHYSLGNMLRKIKDILVIRERYGMLHLSSHCVGFIWDHALSVKHGVDLIESINCFRDTSGSGNWGPQASYLTLKSSIPKFS